MHPCNFLHLKTSLCVQQSTKKIIRISPMVTKLCSREAVCKHSYIMAAAAGLVVHYLNNFLTVGPTHTKVV